MYVYNLPFSKGTKVSILKLEQSTLLEMIRVEFFKESPEMKRVEFFKELISVGYFWTGKRAIMERKFWIHATFALAPYVISRLMIMIIIEAYF